MTRRACTRFLTVIVIVLLPLLVASCGSDTAGGDPPSVGEAFAVRALAVCEAALAQKEAQRPFPFPDFNPTQPDPSKFPEVAAFLEEETAVTFGAWLADLEALGEPPSGQEAWGDVLTAVETIVRLNEEQVVAAEGGDIEAFIEATAALGETQVALVRATGAAGVPECADVHA